MSAPDNVNRQQQQQQQPHDTEEPSHISGERVERLKDTLHGNAEYVRRERMERLHDAEYIRGLLAFDPDPSRGGLSRMVDMKIPLWGVLSALGAFAIMISTLWFTVQNQGVMLREIQVALREGSSSNTAADRELARLTLQVEQLKEETRDARNRLEDIQRELREPQATQRRSSTPPPARRRQPLTAFILPEETPL